MLCLDVESWMLNDETPNRPPEEVRRHVRSCAACRKRFGQLVRLLHEVHEEPLPVVSSAAKSQLLLRLEPRQAPMAIPVTVPMPTRRSKLPPVWMRWAAAAVLCIAFGFGLSQFLKNAGKNDDDRAQKDDDDDRDEPKKPEQKDLAQLGVEERVLTRHLILAETREPTRRLHTLSDMAGDVREESIDQARKGKAEELPYLTWLHARILHDGVIRSAAAVRAKSSDLLEPVVTQLRQAETGLDKLAQSAPEMIAIHLRSLRRQVSETASALSVGGDVTPPDPNPPLRFASRGHLQVLVLTSLQMATEEDPVKRAEQSTDAVDSLTQQLLDQSGKLDPNEVVKLTENLEALMEQGIRGNLGELDFEKIDPLQRKQLEKLQERAEIAVDRAKQQVVERARADADRMKQQQALQMQLAQANLDRALEMAKQLQKPGKGKGSWKKPKGPPFKMR